MRLQCGEASCWVLRSHTWSLPGKPLPGDCGTHGGWRATSGQEIPGDSATGWAQSPGISSSDEELSIPPPLVRSG